MGWTMLRISQKGAALKHLKSLEVRTICTWLAFTGALWVFFALGSEVAEGDTRGFDHWITAILRTSGSAKLLGPPWMQEAMRDITALGSFTFLTLFTTIVVVSLAFHRRRREAVALAIVAIGAQASVQMLKFFYDRPRPEEIVQNIQTYSASFPSGHTTESTAIFLAAATVISTLEKEKRTKLLTYFIAMFAIFGVGLSRIYLGVHWPTDVLGGWVLGSAWALAAWWFLRRITA